MIPGLARHYCNAKINPCFGALKFNTVIMVILTIEAWILGCGPRLIHMMNPVNSSRCHIGMWHFKLALLEVVVSYTVDIW